MFAAFKVFKIHNRRKSLPLQCVARAFFMSGMYILRDGKFYHPFNKPGLMPVTYLLYMAGSTIRAYVVMAYASLLCKDFEQRCGGYPPFLYPHKCS
jgi:hypothetical protein